MNNNSFFWDYSYARHYSKVFIFIYCVLIIGATLQHRDLFSISNGETEDGAII